MIKLPLSELVRGELLFLNKWHAEHRPDLPTSERYLSGQTSPDWKQTLQRAEAEAASSVAEENRRHLSHEALSFTM